MKSWLLEMLLVCWHSINSLQRDSSCEEKVHVAIIVNCIQ